MIVSQIWQFVIFLSQIAIFKLKLLVSRFCFSLKIWCQIEDCLKSFQSYKLRLLILILRYCYLTLKPKAHRICTVRSQMIQKVNIIEWTGSVGKKISTFSCLSKSQGEQISGHFRAVNFQLVCFSFQKTLLPG